MKGETLFTEIMGSSPEMRVLDFLLIHHRFDYSLTTICENANVSWSTIHIFWPRWVQNKIIKKTRRIGRAQLYQLDEENENVKKLKTLHRTILFTHLDAEIAKQKKQKLGQEQKVTVKA